MTQSTTTRHPEAPETAASTPATATSATSTTSAPRRPEDRKPGDIRPYDAQRVQELLADPAPPTPTQAEADAFKAQAHGDTPDAQVEHRDMRPAAGGSYQTR
jgi:hypothetical protein